MAKKLALTTGPSIFQPDINEMMEKFFGWNYAYITHNDKDCLDEWADRADIYFGGGGRDVFPASYNGDLENRANMENFDRMRDLREIYLIKKFIQLGKPVAGVCRNLQLYCAVFRNLYLADISSSESCHSAGGAGIKLNDDELEFIHKVNLSETGEDYYVNSAHHMGVFVPKTIPAGFEVIATAGMGGKNDYQIIEWFKDKNKKVNMVQWHPEKVWKTNEISQMFLEEVKASV